MTIRAAKFTPEVLLSAPRRSPGVPNANATKILYSVSTYSFADHAQKNEIRVLDVKSQQTTLITDASSASEPTWLNDETILLLSSGDDGVTTVKIGKVDNFGNSSYTAGTFDGPIGNLKLIELLNNEFGVAVTGKVTQKGELYNPEKASKPLSTGRLYKSLFVRHWDHWITENRNAILLGKLCKVDGKFVLGNFTNALKDTGLESPIDPFGGTEDFDIHCYGLAFTAKDPDLDPATHTKTNIYVSAKPYFWDNIDSGIPEIKKVELNGFEGASSAPVWSSSGYQLAFLSMRTDGYESDKRQAFIIPDYRNPSWVKHIFASEDGKGKWDRSPEAIYWQHGDGHLYFTAEEDGRVDLFTTTYGGLDLQVPRMIVRGGSISDVKPLKNRDLFISSTSLVDNSVYSILPIGTDGFSGPGKPPIYTIAIDDRPFDSDPKNLTTKYVSSATRSGSMFGLSRKQIDEVRWPGAGDNTSIHAWIVKPSTFNPKEKYPLAYLIHGGPQGAWTDSWSTRWNPAVFAEQGYVVIAPNPTGSTGYGQDFVDAITGEWGGLPYQDLVLGFDWIKKNLSYVDTDRAVALGASYGGYMMNWIQGHDLGREFKALVTHDGVFSMTGQLATEELYFPFHDLQGPLWKQKACNGSSGADSWAKWDPSRFADNWATPHLIIHSELDYRLTISEGLSAFNVLQAKGVDSQFLTFPDENHWVLKPENSLLWHEVVLDWINGHVGLEKYSEQRLKK